MPKTNGVKISSSAISHIEKKYKLSKAETSSMLGWAPGQTTNYKKQGELPAQHTLYLTILLDHADLVYVPPKPSFAKLYEQIGEFYPGFLPEDLAICCGLTPRASIRLMMTGKCSVPAQKILTLINLNLDKAESDEERISLVDRFKQIALDLEERDKAEVEKTKRGKLYK